MLIATLRAALARRCAPPRVAGARARCARSAQLEALRLEDQDTGLAAVRGGAAGVQPKTKQTRDSTEQQPLGSRGRESA